MVKRPFEKLLIVSLLVLTTVALTYFDLLWRIDRGLYDSHIQWLATPASPEIVIIEIDPQSLNVFGRWPWPRDSHARLLDVLASAKPKAIALDVLFSEADNQHPQLDNALARAMDQAKPVVLPVIFETNGHALVETRPLPIFARHAMLGHANVDLDKDGLCRSVPLYAGIGAPNRPALALALYQLHHSEPERPGSNLRAANSPAPNIGLIEDRRIWLPFYDTTQDFQRFSYAEVLSGAVSADNFTDKYVLVGLTASGIERDTPTPLTIDNRPMSGIDVAASTLDALVKQTFWQPLPGLWQFFLTLILASAGIQLSVLWPHRRLPLVIGLQALGILLLSSVLLRVSQIWFAPSAAICVLLLSYPLRSWRHFEKLIQSLFAERKRAYVILNAITDCVITTSPDGHIDFMNSAAQDLLDRHLPQTINHHVDDIFLVEISGQQQKLGALIRQCIARHDVIRYEHCPLSIFDQTLTANLVIAPMFGGKGKLLGTTITVNDIGERLIMAKLIVQKAEQQTMMTQLLNQAESATQAKSQFLSRISHELRTPLNAIIGFAQLLQTEPAAPALADHQRESVNEILRAGRHLLDLINDLLDLAKIEAGKINLNLGQFELSDLLNECQTMIAPLAHGQGLTIKIDNPLPDPCLLRIDQTRGKQILLNFLSNAVKYNRPNGTITVTCKPVAGDRIRIAVTDSGQGLSEEQQRLLFQPYQRLNIDDNAIEGVGIGLLISKQLAELMDGAVGVSSQPNLGSTFWVEFKRLAP